MGSAKSEFKVQYMPIGSLVPYENNPRVNDSAVDYVARSIERYGFRAPICVDKDMVIVYGHTRLKAARKLGLKEVPVYVAADMTPEQANEYRLADNSVGEVAVWDKMKLDIEFKKLPDFNPMDFGFFNMFKEDTKPFSLEADDDDVPTLEGVNEGGGDVTLLDDDPYTDNITALGLPIIDITRVPKWEDVKDLRLFLGKRDTDFDPPYFYIWGSAEYPDIKTRNIFEDGCVAFYTEDERFELLYPYPSAATTKLLNAHVKMCVMPNFSSYPRMSKAERLFQLYKSHFVARYFQKNGLLVIPDFMAQADIWEYTVDLIPKGCPFAVQLHQHFGSDDEMKEWMNIIKKKIDHCAPPYVVVYYSQRNRRNFEKVFDGLNVLWIETFAAQRSRLMKKT